MKYERSNRFQRCEFSCLEELKCDMLENLLALRERQNYPMVTVIVDRVKAKKFLDVLLNADVNGFKTSICEGDTLDDCYRVIDSYDYSIITLDDDGVIYVEKCKVGYGGIGEDGVFVYLPAEIEELWSDIFRQRSTENLVYTIQE